MWSTKLTSVDTAPEAPPGLGAQLLLAFSWIVFIVSWWEDSAFVLDFVVFSMLGN